MTANELMQLFNTNYDTQRNFPKSYEVDHETYANCCKHIFRFMGAAAEEFGDIRIIQLVLGPNNGIMFKAVELILKEKND